ncbi:MAG: glycosyltransferase family 2 protein [Candidatus Uhrbacteria bacterium]|nr:glycosyltransferase family 2 protein [Candidatus Uhrbacteria bacterium]
MKLLIKRIAAIVPAYNEENNIRTVLRVLRQSHELSEIIVVDDGSTDQTGKAALEEGVRVVRQENQGKAGAMATGANNTSADILFFSDADLLGLTPGHIADVIAPVRDGSAGMTVGMRDRGPVGIWMMEHILPIIGGERAISRDIFLNIVQGNTARRFGIEILMNAYCKKNRIPVRLVRMQGVGHIIKEVRYGFWTGFIARVRMIGEILKAKLFVLFH